MSGNVGDEKSLDIPLTDAMKSDELFCKDGQFKSFCGLPVFFKNISKWWKVYKELVAQMALFKEVTKGKANYKHVDFHLWFNLTLPVAIALNVFTWTHKIKSVRFIGVHHGTKRKIFRIISWNPFVKFYHSGNIDYFLTILSAFGNSQTIELYCHQDYMNGVLMDNSKSYFGHEKKSMKEQVHLLNINGVSKFISWDELD